MGWTQEQWCVTRKFKTGVGRDCIRKGRGFGEAQLCLQDPARPAVGGDMVLCFVGVAWVWQDQLWHGSPGRIRNALCLWLSDFLRMCKLEA